MIAQTRPSEHHYDQYVKLLRQLHCLIADGEGDSQEADAVRDELDIHAPFLTDIESQRADGLSAALYSLSGNEIYAPEDQINPAPELELKTAWEREEYERVLTLLRRPAPYLSADQI